MTRFLSLTKRQLPAGHVLVPTAAIGGLSLALALGLELVGIHTRTNADIARMFSRGGAEGFPNQMPSWLPWVAAAIIATALSAAILETPGTWRRIILWLSASFLVFAWAPVLSLAAYQPAISVPWIVTFWSGICALVYAANHRMAIDETSNQPS